MAILMYSIIHHDSPVAATQATVPAAAPTIALGSVLEGCTIGPDAECTGADLSRSNLSGADLRGARLTDVDLTGSDLTHVNLSSAWLVRVTLDNADLTGAKLTGATVMSPQFDGDFARSFPHVRLCNTAMPDGHLENRDCGHEN
jgi:hypothetical protein